MRMRTADSRSRHKRGCIVDLFLSAVFALAALGLFSQMPPLPKDENAPYHHNDGGDVVLLLLWPVAWVILSLIFTFWRQGCRYRAPEAENQAQVVRPET